MQPQQYVGIDLHRRRSVIVRRSAEGETLEVSHVNNDDLLAFERAVTAAGEHPEVVLEAAYGWYWATDLLEELGCNVHLAHPLGNNWGNRRVKNDTRDAEDLADLLRLGRLAEAWIAPPKVRELRELVRYRAKLVCLRTNCKLQVHAVLAKEGVSVPMTDLFGVLGSELLETCHLTTAYRTRVESLRDLIEVFDAEIAKLEGDVRHELRGHVGYQAIQQIPGVGPLFASVFVAEIGDATRFRSPAQLASWAGLTPKHHETDLTVHRGPITKMWDHASCAGRPSRRPNARHQARSCEPTLSASPLITATAPVPARSPALPWRERSSPSSTTASGTAPSAPRPSRRRRDAGTTPQGAWSPPVMAPGSPAWPRRLIDPVLVVPQHSMPSKRRRNDRQPRQRFALPKHASDLETTPGVPSPEREAVTID
jgi:transposase